MIFKYNLIELNFSLNLRIKICLFFRNPSPQVSTYEDEETLWMDGIPEGWRARKVAGPATRELPAPGTDSPATPDLERRLQNLRYTPPLPPVHLVFRGATPDVPMAQAEEPVPGEAVEEKGGRVSVGVGTPEDRDNNVLAGAEEVMQVGEAGELQPVVDPVEGAGPILPLPVETYWTTQQVNWTAVISCKRLSK